MKPLQLAIPQLRRGKMGSMPLGADYMEGVAKRAARMERACRFKPCRWSHNKKSPLPAPTGEGTQPTDSQES